MCSNGNHKKPVWNHLKCVQMVPITAVRTASLTFRGGPARGGTTTASPHRPCPHRGTPSRHPLWPGQPLAPGGQNNSRALRAGQARSDTRPARPLLRTTHKERMASPGSLFLRRAFHYSCRNQSRPGTAQALTLRTNAGMASTCSYRSTYACDTAAGPVPLRVTLPTSVSVF